MLDTWKQDWSGARNIKIQIGICRYLEIFSSKWTFSDNRKNKKWIEKGRFIELHKYFNSLSKQLRRAEIKYDDKICRPVYTMIIDTCSV